MRIVMKIIARVIVKKRDGGTLGRAISKELFHNIKTKEFGLDVRATVEVRLTRQKSSLVLLAIRSDAGVHYE